MQFKWLKKPRRILVCGEQKEPDPPLLRVWQEEGFAVMYLAPCKSRRDFAAKLGSISEPLDFGEQFAIVAYGEAAGAVLEACMRPMLNLCALVCYYPSDYPSTTTGLPPNLEVVIHLAPGQKRQIKYPTYSYPNAKGVGFAEPDNANYDKIAAKLAWTRSLKTMREAFSVDPDLEGVRERHLSYQYMEKDVAKTLEIMHPDAHVTFVPTSSGGVGTDELRRFYQDVFMPGVPPSLRMRLLSRTIGTDQVVDEMVLSFVHSQEMPWILPGIAPTKKKVEIALVSMVRIHGGKLVHEHCYWDQASVLAQVGLIDAWKLPVLGPSAARKAVNEDSEPSNPLLQRREQPPKRQR